MRTERKITRATQTRTIDSVLMPLVGTRYRLDAITFFMPYRICCVNYRVPERKTDPTFDGLICLRRWRKREELKKSVGVLNAINGLLKLARAPEKISRTDLVFQC